MKWLHQSKLNWNSEKKKKRHQEASSSNSAGSSVVAATQESHFKMVRLHRYHSALDIGGTSVEGLYWLAEILLARFSQRPTHAESDDGYQGCKGRCSAAATFLFKANHDLECWSGWGMGGYILRACSPTWEGVAAVFFGACLVSGKWTWQLKIPKYLVAP